MPLLSVQRSSFVFPYRWLEVQVDNLTCTQRWVQYLRLLQESIWPGGVLPVVPKPVRTEEQKLAAEKQALQILMGILPGKRLFWVQHLVGVLTGGIRHFSSYRAGGPPACPLNYICWIEEALAACMLEGDSLSSMQAGCLNIQLFSFNKNSSVLLQVLRQYSKDHLMVAQGVSLFIKCPPVSAVSISAGGRWNGFPRIQEHACVLYCMPVCAE